MLTAFQCATGAYMTEDGELLCEECFTSEDVYAKPVSNYGLDEWQSEEAVDYDWELYGEQTDGDPNELHAQCEPTLYDANGHELREAYHYHREEEAS